MATSTQADQTEYVGNGNPTGTVIGQTSSEKIAFYGAAPVARGAAVTTVTTTGATSTTNAYGFTTAAQADAIVTAVNALISRVQTLGLIA